MMCAWQELLKILPGWLRKEVDQLDHNRLCEIRLRTGQSTELNFGTDSKFLDRIAARDDLDFVVNTASRYSPWAATSLNRGI